MRTRLILLAVPLLLFASSAVVESDESDPGGGVTLLNEEERTVKRYSWQGIPVHDDEVAPTMGLPRPRLLSLKRDDYAGFLAGFQVDYTRPWSIAGNGSARGLLDAGGLADEFDDIVYGASFRHDASGLTVEAASDAHDRARWLFEQLRAYYSQRVHFTVFELDETAESGAVSVERASALRSGAKLTGTRTVRPGELALISNVRTFAYTADYDVQTATSAAIPAPVMLKMNTGRELALSACATGDGGLIVRGLHGRSKLVRMRTFGRYNKVYAPEESGVFELPDVDYELEEGAVRLRDGQAWVFGDRHLVFAEIDAPFLTAAHSRGTIRLIAPELYRVRVPSQLSAVPGDDIEKLYFDSQEYPWPSQGMLEHVETHDHGGPWEETIDTEVMATIRATTPDEIHRLGSLICLMWEEDRVPERTTELKEPAGISLQVRRYLVGRDADLPGTLLQGAPDEAALKALGEPDYSRRLSQLEDGVIEDAGLRLSNFVASFDTNTATGVAVYDTNVATMVSGTRLHISFRRDGPDGVGYDALFATAPPGTIKDSPAPGNKRGNVQTASIESTAVRLAGTLKVGESVSTITPSPAYEDQLIVLVITRVEP